MESLHLENWLFNLSISKKKTTLERSFEEMLTILFPSDLPDFNSWFLHLNSSSHRQEFAQALGLPIMSADQLAAIFNEPTVFGGALENALQRRLYYSLSALKEIVSHKFAPMYLYHLFGPRIEKLFVECGKAIENLDEKEDGIEASDRLCCDLEIQDYNETKLLWLKDRTGIHLHDTLMFFIGILEFLTSRMASLKSKGDNKTWFVDIGSRCKLFIDKYDRLEKTLSGETLYLNLVKSIAAFTRACIQYGFKEGQSAIKESLKLGLEKLIANQIYRKNCYLPLRPKDKASSLKTFVDMPEIFNSRRYELFRAINLMRLSVELKAIDLMDPGYREGFRKEIREIPYLDWEGKWISENDRNNFENFMNSAGARNEPWWLSYDLFCIYSYIEYVRCMLLFDRKRIPSATREIGRFKFWKQTHLVLNFKANENKDRLETLLQKKAVGFMILGPPGTGKSSLARIIPDLLEIEGFEFYEIALQYVYQPDDLAKRIINQSSDPYKIKGGIHFALVATIFSIWAYQKKSNILLGAWANLELCRGSTHYSRPQYVGSGRAKWISP